MEPASKPRRFRRWIGRLAFLNLLIVAGVTAWFITAADEHWLATLLLFGPRWIALCPLILIVPLTLLARSWGGLLACGIAAVLIAGPFMGGTVNIGSEFTTGRRDGTVRLLTFNADGKACDRAKFQAFIAEFQPDVVCLQDAGRLDTDDFPAGYTLNDAADGLKFASKFPIEMIGRFSDPVLGPTRGAAKFRVNLPFGVREIATVHLPTPRAGLEAIRSRQPNAIATLEAVMAQRSAASMKVKQWLDGCPLVAGDFNLPVESVVYRRDWGGHRNAWSEAGLGWGWTMFSTRAAVRIDQIVYTNPWQCRSVLIGPDLGSAHRPLQADLLP